MGGVSGIGELCGVDEDAGGGDGGGEEPQVAVVDASAIGESLDLSAVLVESLGGEVGVLEELDLDKTGGKQGEDADGKGEEEVKAEAGRGHTGRFPKEVSISPAGPARIRIHPRAR